MKWLKSAKKNKRIRKRKVSRTKYLVRKYVPKLVLLFKMIIILALLGGLVYLLMASTLFDIEIINVKGTADFVYPEDVLLIAETNALGKNIFSFDQQELEAKLEDNLLGAKNYKVIKRYPKSLEIVVQERVPIALIYKDKEDYYFVDEDGYILGYADPLQSDLPKIRYEKDIKIGFFIDKNLVPIYLELTGLFTKQEIQVSSMSFSPKFVHLYLENGPEVLVGNEKNKEEALKAVAALLKEAELEDKEIRRIDLRYDKVIVLFR